MNFGKGGQNIVQAGSNNPNVFRGAGNILGAFLGTKMRRNERDYNREQDYAARKDFEDYKNNSIVSNTRSIIKDDNLPSLPFKMLDSSNTIPE